jgi:perosamine synthetase
MKKIPVMIPCIGKEEIEKIAEAVNSGWVAQGPMVEEFEKKVADHEGKKYAVATTSCTTALHLAMVALDVKSGEDVIVPSFTFVATPNSVMYTGANPVFVDVDSKTYNMSVESLKSKIENDYVLNNNKLINKTTKNILVGIIAVNEFGLCANLNEIKKIADKNHLFLVEDSACAFGAKTDKKNEGDYGIISCLSFHPRKSITTGEGGMALTNNKKLYERMTHLRSHGASISEVKRHLNKGYLLPNFNELGFNYRMTDLSGAMGLAQMEKCEYITSKRRELANNYDILLKKIDFLIPPFVPKGYYHTYQSYVCILDYKKLNLKSVKAGNIFRNNLMEFLEENGIATRVGTHATHMLGLYKEKNKIKDKELFGAYYCDQLSITLPLYVTLSEEEQKYVVNKIKEGCKILMENKNEKN